MPVAVVILVFVGMVIATYIGAPRRAKPWYAAKVVDEGSGRIDEDTGLDERY